MNVREYIDGRFRCKKSPLQIFDDYFCVLKLGNYFSTYMFVDATDATTDTTTNGTTDVVGVEFAYLIQKIFKIKNLYLTILTTFDN